MDVLRKELNSIYASQNLDEEYLDTSILTDCKLKARTAAEVDNDCRVITDASADRSYIFGGSFAVLAGLCSDGQDYFKEVDSSDEDIIYNRIHPEDLVDKRMLEFEFFKFIDLLPGDDKLKYKATCRFRIKNRTGEYVYVNNSTRIMRPSPRGRIWLILCCYDLAPVQEPAPGITPHIVNNTSGEIIDMKLSDKRSHILTTREKEILNLIRIGKPSKQIADALGISVNTVNRHRQNILGKLSVGNSLEAVMAAAAMKLL